MAKDTKTPKTRIQTTHLATPGTFYKASHGGDEASATWCEVKYLGESPKTPKESLEDNIHDNKE